jgi:hypothetical protein
VNHVVIFAGPTLSAAEVTEQLEADCRPPARQGDIYRAALTSPRAIGLVDGYFHCQPSPWHKEILWALSRGIHVYGASSLGALRAAELCSLGMKGVGRIFDAFRDGQLTRDDEVALVHGPADVAYRRLSEPLVNIRFTLGAAVREGVVTSALGGAAIRAAEGINYMDRTYPSIFQSLADSGISSEEVDRLRAWVGSNGVDQKKLDAILMLKEIAGSVPRGAELTQVTFSFEVTDGWARFCDRVDETSGEAGRGADSEVLLEDELRMAGEFWNVRSEAMRRALAIQETERRGLSLAKEAIYGATGRFFRAKDLLTTETVRAWMDRNEIGDAELEALMAEEARVSWVDEMFADHARRAFKSVLKTSDRYGTLRRRTLDKEKMLADRGLSEPTFADANLPSDPVEADRALCDWVASEVIFRTTGWRGAEEAARVLGFASLVEFRRAALRERCYRQLLAIH